MPTGIYEHKPRSEETKRKISESHKGKCLTEEHKKKISEANMGHKGWSKGLTKKTNESVRKISESRKGKHCSNETKLKMSKAQKGHKHSEETKRKIGEANSISLKGNHRSEETKRKISRAKKGEKSHLWRGGITPLNLLIRSGFKYRQWRSDIFTRDNFTCQECGEAGVILNAHHIKSFTSILQKYEITTLEEALNCEELWNINNGITLCKECHKKTDNFKTKAKNFKNKIELLG